MGNKERFENTKAQTSWLLRIKAARYRGKKVMSAKNNLVNSTIIIKKMVVKRQNKTTAEDGYQPCRLPTVFASVALPHSGVRK